jgi:hypothetical protein
MEYEDFLKASDALKKFMNEQDELNNVIKVISPSSTGVVEFGNLFIDNYIRVVELVLGDKYEWFSWFVFDNDFGRKGMVVTVDGKEYKISNEQEFYDVCILM